jgi:hypothetical protein
MDLNRIDLGITLFAQLRETGKNIGYEPEQLRTEQSRAVRPPSPAFRILAC